MYFSMRKMTKISITFILIMTFTDVSFTQNYFPLEIGNRWDYNISTQTHGGNFYNSKLSVEIIAKTKLANDKEYYVLSNDGLFDWQYLRYENDSLFCFSNNDSTDCLVFAFNQFLNSSYYTCKYDTIQYLEQWNYSNFGILDTQQYHVTNGIAFEMSKFFGLVSSDKWSLLSETWYNLRGCLISGITYGSLLSVETKSDLDNYSFNLEQNYPNPFNPTTRINYTINKADHITLSIYDNLGRFIKKVIDEYQNPGIYNKEIDMHEYSSGIYFYKLISGNYHAVRKMLLIK